MSVLQARLSKFSLLTFAVGAGLFMSACTPQTFVGTVTTTPGKTEVPTPTPNPSPTPIPAPTPKPTPAPAKKVSESFTQDESANKVDILVINDNSYSMEVEQKKMAERFPSFVSALGDLDYQISMTTTDVDSKSAKLNLGGRVVNWAGTTSKVLTPKTAKASDVFKNTIRRAETIGCVDRNDCPSGNEQPLLASMMAIDQRFTANAGVFRDNVDLAIVVLSDEDELSDGPTIATKPKDVVQRFESYFGKTKLLRVFGIVVKSGDTVCLKDQKKQTSGGNGAFYATHVEELAKITSGSTNSICDADYSKSLTDISKSVRRLVGTFQLGSEPKPGTVQVTLTPTPSPAIPWHIEGKNLVFDTPPTAGTRVEVSYEDN